jgi:MFS family permease
VPEPTAPAPPTPEHTDDSTRVAVLFGILFGLTSMGSAAAALAVVPMAEAYDVSVGAATWTISLYALLLGVGTAVYGRIADLRGPRGPMTFGVTMMSLGALLAAVAPWYPLHLVGRLTQGAGAAAVATLGAAVLTARYSGAVKAAALVRLAAVTAAVTSLGPMLGGALIDLFSWRAVFALPMVGLLLLPMVWPVMGVGGTGARLDFVGAAITALTAGGAVLLVQSPSVGAQVAVVGGVLLGLGAPTLWWWVRRRPDGFLPVVVLRNAVVVRSAFAAAAVPAAWFALLIAIPAVLLAEDWAAWQIGLILLPTGAVSLLMTRYTGPLLHRLGPARSLVLASALSAGALLVGAAGSSLPNAPVIVLAVTLLAVAFGIGQPALNAAVGGAVEEPVRGVALGIGTLVFLVGASVGSAVIGGLGDLIGIAETLAMLAVLPVLGGLLVASTRHD